MHFKNFTGRPFFFRKSGFCFLWLLCMSLFNQALSQQVSTQYPRITAYMGILHPLVSFSEGSKPHYNFDGSYMAGMPTGINIWKNTRIGFSMEFVPMIRSGNGTTRMSNFLFHPGVLFGLGNGFTMATRAAFETSGRFGFTPVLNKIIIHQKNSNVFLAVPLPVRFGNNQPASLNIGMQFGIIF